MKRITFDGLFCDIAMCKAAHEDCPHGICSQRQTWERLKLLEDVLGDNYDLDRLRELVQADWEGRCVVLKFAPGSKVYRVWFNPSNGKLFITEHIMKSKEMCLEAELWNDAYKTKEEAEKALEEMEGNGNGAETFE